jgi:hypothetical protein
MSLLQQGLVCRMSFCSQNTRFMRFSSFSTILQSRMSARRPGGDKRTFLTTSTLSSKPYFYSGRKAVWNESKQKRQYLHTYEHNAMGCTTSTTAVTMTASTTKKATTRTTTTNARKAENISRRRRQQHHCGGHDNTTTKDNGKRWLVLAECLDSVEFLKQPRGDGSGGYRPALPHPLLVKSGQPIAAFRDGEDDDETTCISAGGSSDRS